VPGATMNVSMLRRPTNLPPRSTPLRGGLCLDVALIPGQTKQSVWNLDDEEVELGARRESVNHHGHRLDRAARDDSDVRPSVRQAAGRRCCGRSDHVEGDLACEYCAEDTAQQDCPHGFPVSSRVLHQSSLLVFRYESCNTGEVRRLRFPVQRIQAPFRVGLDDLHPGAVRCRFAPRLPPDFWAEVAIW
jgi:hypothetical protein